MWITVWQKHTVSSTTTRGLLFFLPQPHGQWLQLSAEIPATPYPLTHTHKMCQKPDLKQVSLSQYLCKATMYRRTGKYYNTDITVFCTIRWLKCSHQRYGSIIIIFMVILIWLAMQINQLCSQNGIYCVTCCKNPLRDSQLIFNALYKITLHITLMENVTQPVPESY